MLFAMLACLCLSLSSAAVGNEEKTYAIASTGSDVKVREGRFEYDYYPGKKSTKAKK